MYVNEGEFLYRWIDTETADVHDVKLKEGDVVRYGESFFEITELIEERELFGQNEFRFEVRATCSKLRDGAFNGR